MGEGGFDGGLRRSGLFGRCAEYAGIQGYGSVDRLCCAVEIDIAQCSVNERSKSPAARALRSGKRN
jgi:hypothetical protein